MHKRTERRFIMGKTLVAYFSASGVTAKTAKRVAEAAGADLFEIRPQEPYTKEDLDWLNKQSRSSVEMNDPSSRPAIADKVADMKQYDTVIIGFPIWWYVAPTIINTFLESCDFSDFIALFIFSLNLNDIFRNTVIINFKILITHNLLAVCLG